MRTTFSRSVGNRLKFARDEAGLTTTALAEQMELTEWTIRRHLRGDSSLDGATIARYAAVLHVSPADLLPRWVPEDAGQPTDGARARQDSNLQPSDFAAESAEAEFVADQAAAA
jgi:transcriptional regulator with XRE-family HTH domain